MPIGRTNPCPIVLGGDADTGWTAKQHARCAADAAAIVRGMPFARVTVDTTATGASVTYYRGQNGNGTDNAPTVTRTAAGTTYVQFAASYTDDYGISAPLHIRGARATVHGAASRTATVAITAPNELYVYCRTGAGVLLDSDFTLTVK